MLKMMLWLTQSLRRRLQTLLDAHVKVAVVWMTLGTVWLLLGRPAAPQVLPDGLRLIARTDPDRVRVWLDGQSWTCSPSRPSTPGDTTGLAPLGRHAAIQPSEPGDAIQEDDDER